MNERFSRIARRRGNALQVGPLRLDQFLRLQMNSGHAGSRTQDQKREDQPRT